MKATRLRRGVSANRFNDSTIQRFDLTLANRQRTRPVDLRLLRRMVQTLLGELLNLAEAKLDLSLVAAREMTRLNETFLHHAGSTDVIAFNYSEEAKSIAEASRKGRARLSQRAAARIQSDGALGQTRPTSRDPGCIGARVLHGEILVCVDEAVAQARRFRTTWRSEVVRYVVHGVLHLQGYTDLRPAARRRMKAVENRLVRQLTGPFRTRPRPRRPRA